MLPSPPPRTLLLAQRQAKVGMTLQALHTCSFWGFMGESLHVGLDYDGLRENADTR